MATNSEIIYKAAVNAGIYTEQQAAAILMSGRALPIHTFMEWKNLGYSVKKGEKAALHVDLWNYTTKPSKAAREQAAAEGKELADDPHYYLKLSHLFTLDQVKRTGSSDETSDAGEQPAADPAEKINENEKHLEHSSDAAEDNAPQINETPAPAPSSNPLRDIRRDLDDFINGVQLSIM